MLYQKGNYYHVYNRGCNKLPIFFHKKNYYFLIQKFIDSFEKYAKRRKPILFYYAELDNATWGLKKYFLPKYMNKTIWKNTGSEYIEIEKANHIFSGEDTQEKMKHDILSWLEARAT